LQLRGDATDVRLAQGDSLSLRAAPSQRLVLDGGGEILLLRLTRHSPEQDQQQSALDKKGINTS